MRNMRDWQSLAYLLALPALVAWEWMQPDFSVVAYLAVLILVVGVCCISHNHTHLPIWHWAWLNRLTDLWIGVLQGHPLYMFQPAHIESHHLYNQGEKDITRVLRYTSGNNMLGYLLFPFQVLPALRDLKKRYLRRLWQEDRGYFAWVIISHLPLYALWLGVLLADFHKAVIFVFIPQFVGLHFLLASNYLQHAHAVAGSSFNHSRNFVGWVNWVWLNVGFHTAHHEQPELHWTALPTLHKEMASKIDARLNVTSLGVYTLRTLLLGALFSRFSSRKIQE